MADLNTIANLYNSGVSLEWLKKQYKLSDDDIKKIKEINAKIDKELGAKDGTQPLHGSTEITLKGGAKVLAAKIETHTQPGGGHTDVYMSADGQRYYQYTSAGGEKSEITDSWHSWNETSDKWSIAWQKHKEGNTMEALKLLIQDIEDPTGKIVFTGTAGEYVGVKSIGSIKGLWNVAKNLPQTAKNSWQTIKSFGSWVSKFKEVKNFEQFKSLAMNFIQKMKPAKQIKPSKNLYSRVDWAQCTAMGRRDVIAETLRFGNATEKIQETVLNAENTAKICQNLTKTLGKKINPKDLKVAHFQDDTKVFSRILYYDNVTGKSYCFMQDGAPAVVIEYKYSITGKIKDYDYVGSWVDGKWQPAR